MKAERMGLFARRGWRAWISLIPALATAAAGCRRADLELTLATTTSVEDSGLLGYIHPTFEDGTGIDVRVISTGSGAAIRMGESGAVDLVLAHDPEKLAAFVRSGHGVALRDVMVNDFVVIGPPDDPAGIRGKRDPVEALKTIASAGCTFVSRGDLSGTHGKEQALWRESGLPLIQAASAVRPDGDWYVSVGQGMASTIRLAGERKAYTLSDRGTYLAFRQASGGRNIVVLSEGDPRLRNPYSIVAVNPSRHPHARLDLAMRYIDWITSSGVQAMIGSFKVDGEPLFHPTGQGTASPVEDAFRRVFGILSRGEQGLWRIVGTSVRVSLSSTLLAALLGVPLAFLLAAGRFPGKRGVLLVLHTLLGLPTVVVGLFFYGLLAREGALGSLGILYTLTGIVIGQTVLILPVVTSFVHAAVAAVDPRIHRTALALGIRGRDRWLLVAGEARLGILAAVAAGFGRAVSEVGVSVMLGGNISGSTRTMATAILLEHNKGNLELAMALGLFLLVITMAINVGFRLLVGRGDR